MSNVTLTRECSLFHGPQCQWSLWDMKEFYLDNLLLLAKEMGRLGEHYATNNPSEILDEKTQKENKKEMANHAQNLGELDLHVCRIQCERVSNSFDQEPGQIAKMIVQLSQTMLDECSLRSFMALSPKEAEFTFPRKPLFGEEVEKKFPGAAFEIEEAGKCLGLSRPTASAFHLMRTLEIGIAAAARCLNIPDPIKPSQRNWGAVLKTIKDELDQRAKATLPAPWADPDKAFFEEVYVSLDAVRNPWRNSTMHVESKYTEEEAEHIFIAVRAFMRKLASRMDESGEPKCSRPA
jgi:hypothetical protein